MSTITMGTKESPAPIHISLKLITAGLDKIWWGDQWERSIAKKRRNLEKALRNYPNYVKAKHNTGNYYWLSLSYII